MSSIRPILIWLVPWYGGTRETLMFNQIRLPSLRLWCFSILKSPPFSLTNSLNRLHSAGRFSSVKPINFRKAEFVAPKRPSIPAMAMPIEQFSKTARQRSWKPGIGSFARLVPCSIKSKSRLWVLLAREEALQQSSNFISSKNREIESIVCACCEKRSRRFVQVRNRSWRTRSLDRTKQSCCEWTRVAVGSVEGSTPVEERRSV